ncbi:extensin-like [Parambassis ranga]|uniref:Extensin-like n=1 Tax=Parambassis ranga TaxID=210632 RepID=A0A6P7K1Z5_9TELE|nr:extensin-like [Parambassis ranga]
MALSESRGGNILLCVGLFLFLTSFSSCTRLSRLKALSTLKGDSVLNQSKSKGSPYHHGQLFIGFNSLEGAKPNETETSKNFLEVDTDYQADMGWQGAKPSIGWSDLPKPDNVDYLLKMEPRVECTRDSMMLQVKDAASIPGSLLFVDRSNLSPLPLARLPQSCGYNIRLTNKDLVLVAPYDGCFVTLQADHYVLPLRWCGLPVRMSCPLTRPLSSNPPMVTCHTEGMVVKTEWTISASKIIVKLDGNWEPLMKASQKCGFSVVVHPEGVVISVRYAPCLKKKDGLYTLELAGYGETQVTCPSLLAPKPTQKPVKFPTTVPSQPTTEKTVVSKPDAPNGQLYPPFYTYPFYLKPKPEAQPTTISTTVPEPTLETTTVPAPPEPAAPFGQPFYPYPFYFQPKPEAQPTTISTTVPETTRGTTTIPVPPKPEAPIGQPFYPYPFYFQPKPEAQPTTISTTVPETTRGTTTAPVPPKPEAPINQLYPPYYPYPFYFQPKPEAQPTTISTTVPETTRGTTTIPVPPKPEAPIGQPFYPYPFYFQPRPEAEPTTIAITLPEPTQETTTVPVPRKTEAPTGQLYPPFYPYPYPFYPQPQPEAEPTREPTTVPVPPRPEAPIGQVYPPFYPYPFYSQPKPESEPITKPTPVPEQTTKSPSPGFGSKTPIDEQFQSAQHPALKPPGQIHYPWNLYYPHSVTLPPAISSATPADDQETKENVNPQTGNGGVGIPTQPRYCPQVCPPGFSNCCPQIAFHQHLHHFIPTGLGTKDVSSFYAGLPSLQSLAFGNGLGSAPLPQRLADATTHTPTTSTSATSSRLFLLSGNGKQTHFWPPGGNLASLPGSTPKKIHPHLPAYHYFVPESVYSNLPYLPRNEPLKPPYSGNEPVNPVLQYEPPKQENGQPAENLNPLIGQHPHQQNRPTTKEIHTSLKPQIGHPLVPYYMLEDAPVPLYRSVVPNNDPTRQYGSDSKSKHKQPLNSYSKPKEYVLLQQGPPDLWKSLKPLGSREKETPQAPGKVFQRWRSAADPQANGLSQPIQMNQKQK